MTVRGKALHAVIAATARGVGTAAANAVDNIEQVQEALGTWGVTDVKKGVDVLKEACEDKLAGRLRKASRLRNAQAHPDVNLVHDIEDKLEVQIGKAVQETPSEQGWPKSDAVRFEGKLKELESIVKPHDDELRGCGLHRRLQRG